MDLDGDGYLSMYELEYFYEEQLQRMEALGIETLPFHDCLCQVSKLAVLFNVLTVRFSKIEFVKQDTSSTLYRIWNIYNIDF